MIQNLGGDRRELPILWVARFLWMLGSSPALLIALLGLSCSLLAWGCRRSPTPQDGGSSTAEAETPSANALTVEAPLIPQDTAEAARVVWRFTLDHQVTEVDVTPEGDIVAIGQGRVTVIDKRGRHRWHRNMASRDQVLVSAGCLYVHLPDEETIIGLAPDGEQRWERLISGTLTPLGDGTLLSTDAASARSIACETGHETWMFTPDRLRTLRLVESGESELGLLGELGRQRILFTLSQQGKLLRTTPLPLATSTATRVAPGRTLARKRSLISMVDDEGRLLWSTPITSRTDVTIQGGQVVLTKANTDGVVLSQVFDQDGRATPECSVQVEAEPVSLNAIGSSRFPLLVAVCAGALSSCAEGALTAGPYNRLWACSTKGARVTGLVDARADLYFDLALTQGKLVVAATQASGRETSVVELTPQLKSRRLVLLTGRRMLGPIAGPDGLWLVATCHGLACEEPWTLHAIAGQEATP